MGPRLVIARNGVTRCLQIKGMRHVVMVCWVSALVMTAILFLVGQLLVPDGIVVQWMGNFNPQLQMFARLLDDLAGATSGDICPHDPKRAVLLFLHLAHAREHFCPRSGDAAADHPRPGQQCDHHLFLESGEPGGLPAGKIFDGVWPALDDVAGAGVRRVVPGQPARRPIGGFSGTRGRCSGTRCCTV